MGLRGNARYLQLSSTVRVAASQAGGTAPMAHRSAGDTDFALAPSGHRLDRPRAISDRCSGISEGVNTKRGIYVPALPSAASFHVPTKGGRPVLQWAVRAHSLLTWNV